MQALTLKLINLRNHKESFFELQKETLFTGINGSGKTTVLESLFILFSLKSFKKQALSQAVSFGESFFRIECEIKDNNDFISDVVCIYDGKRKTLFNNEEVDSISNFLYNYPFACYTPEYLGVLSKDQQDRRSFIDRFIFYTDKSHLDDIKIYNRVAAQKMSEYEKDYPDFTLIDVLNDKIIILSEKIEKRRRALVDNINIKLKELYSFVDFNIEEVYIKYTTNIEDKTILSKEKIKRKSYYGIHRDKIDMTLNDKIIEKFSSTGQKKTFVLLSLLSMIKIVEENRKIDIITLLDDFEAALDTYRADFIRKMYSGNRQVIYTSTDNMKLNCPNEIKLNI